MQFVRVPSAAAPFLVLATIVPAQQPRQQARLQRQPPQPQRTGKQALAWQQQRGGYGGYYIPQDRFNLSFGDQHWFRMSPSIYMGYPRFSYGGFAFLMVDPFPEYWADNWYTTDDVYIGYDNGYYLYDRRYPGVGIAVTVDL